MVPSKLLPLPLTSIVGRAALYAQISLVPDVIDVIHLSLPLGMQGYFTRESYYQANLNIIPIDEVNISAKYKRTTMFRHDEKTIHIKPGFLTWAKMSE